MRDTHVLVICVRETHACVSHKCVCASLPGLLLLVWSAPTSLSVCVCVCVCVFVCVCACSRLWVSVSVSVAGGLSSKCPELSAPQLSKRKGGRGLMF